MFAWQPSSGASCLRGFLAAQLLRSVTHWWHCCLVPQTLSGLVVLLLLASLGALLSLCINPSQQLPLVWLLQLQAPWINLSHHLGGSIGLAPLAPALICSLWFWLRLDRFSFQKHNNKWEANLSTISYLWLGLTLFWFGKWCYEWIYIQVKWKN